MQRKLPTRPSTHRTEIENLSSDSLPGRAPDGYRPIARARFDFDAQLVCGKAQLLKAIAIDQSEDHDAANRGHRKQKNFRHRRISAGPLTAEINWLRMLAAPEAVRQVNQRDVEIGKDTEHGGERRTARGVIN